MNYRIETGTFRLFLDCLSTILRDGDIKLVFSEDGLIGTGWGAAHIVLVHAKIPKEQFTQYGSPSEAGIIFDELETFTRRCREQTVELQNADGTLTIISHPSCKKFTLRQIDILETPYDPSKLKVFDDISFTLPGSMFSELIDDVAATFKRDLTTVHYPLKMEGTEEYIKFSAESDIASYQKDIHNDELETFDCKNPAIVQINAYNIADIAKIKIKTIYIEFSHCTPIHLKMEESGVKAEWWAAPVVERD